MSDWPCGVTAGVAKATVVHAVVKDQEVANLKGRRHGSNTRVLTRPRFTCTGRRIKELEATATLQVAAPVRAR